jgi:hypothetical protein
MIKEALSQSGDFETARGLLENILDAAKRAHPETLIESFPVGLYGNSAVLDIQLWPPNLGVKREAKRRSLMQQFSLAVSLPQSTEELQAVRDRLEERINRFETSLGLEWMREQREIEQRIAALMC